MRGANSAPTSRVVDIIELLARRGGDGLRYTDIARDLDLTQATTHSILKTLCDRGWVTRDPAGKTFRLGPGLAPVAEAVGTRPFLPAARAAAVELAAEFGYAASVSEKVGDSLAVTAFEGGESPWPGDRIPYAPPFGVGFAAWDTDEERRAWIGRAASADPAIAARLEEILAQTRDRGFDVDYVSPAVARAASLVDTLDSGAIALPPSIRGVLDQLLVEFTALGFPDISARREQPVAAVAAPVFDHRGRVALLLAVHPLVARPQEQIDDIGRRLVRTATAISASA
ncbi:helix-turn-helix domain-containing protein [Streptomyces sp. S.PB5]|uniref:helix-turn-helix domain-containing protein n=1 Tax=Streptomyces sp. S.PB5 TaxID=3020844 RepID=UPI0025AF5204|nr:helix-turn-helix domain-containing protein [Streptomyces sp. S.PB5]MDN3021368.1 helix-turn-helix domain-containing protein [Streptomyces sp. S.PB5]